MTPADLVTVATGGLIAGTGGWVWLTGELAGRIARGRWPRVPAGAVPGIVARLLGHVGDLRSAWPASARPGLPGDPALVAVAAALVAVVAAFVALGWTVVRAVGGGHRWSPPPPRATWRLRPRLAHRVSVAGHLRWWAPAPPGPGRGARWATSRDLAPLRVTPGSEGAQGRVVLGRCGRAVVATESQHSVLVVGPTQSGKSTALGIPAILEWAGPVMATSVKDDLVAATLDWRRRRGRCWVFDPTTSTSGDGTAVPRSTWSPLPETVEWAGAQRMAAWLVDATPARSGMTDGAFWFSAAAKVLAPLLLAASRGGAAMADVVAWNTTDRFDEALAILDGAGQGPAAAALAACAARDQRLRSSVAATLETVLAPFDDPVVARATATSDIDPRGLLGGPHTLYLCGPSHEQARVQGLFAALVSSVVAAAVDAVHERGGTLDPPLLVVLDEAANIAPIRDLDVLASTAAGLGIQLVTVCQDLAQLASRYGADRSRTIANNHRAKLVLSGVSDLTTLDFISGLAGETAVAEETVTRDLRDGRRTRSAGVAFRHLAPTDELRRIDPGDGVLVYGHLPAARLRLRPWYRDPALRRKVPGQTGGGR